MADDIKIVVKVVGQQDIVKTTKSLKAMESGVKSLSKDLDAGRISEKQFNTGLKELRRTVDGSFSSWQKAKSAVDNYSKAVLQASDAAKQAKIDKEVAKVSASYDRLKASIDPVFAAQQRMKKAHAEIRAALKAEVITRDEAAASLRRYRTALKNGQVAGQALNKGMNRAGVLAQQAGYQFGDFAVQVQSGTNVFVAFGQQATQLVGTFSMLAKSTKMIGLFAGLGVAIPVLTGIAAAIMRTREASKVAEPKVKSFSEVVEALRGKSKSTAQELRLLQSVFKDIAELDATDKIRQLEEQISSLETSAKTVLEDFVKDLGGGEAQVRVAVGQVDSAAVQSAIAAQKAILQAKIDSLRVELEREQSSSKLLEIEESYRELMGEINEEAQKELEAAEELADKRKESQAAFKDQIIAQANLLALLQIEKDLGKDHADYRARLIAQEEARLRKLVEQKEITESQAKAALYLYEETLKVNGELEASANSANNLADALKEAASAMSSLSSFGDSLDKALAVSRAKVQALKSGVDATIAGSIAGKRADLSTRIKQGLASNVPIGTLMAEIDSSSSKISELEASETERKAREAAARKSSGSKKSPAEELQEYLDKLKNQSELERELVGFFGEKRTIEEAVIKARQKYGEATVAKQEAELRGTLAQIEAEKERQRVLEEAKQQQEEVASVIADNFGSAFMSIVDGTKTAKEAFKDMARSIIKQLFQILVVERMVKSIKSFISPSISATEANGGAWQGGSKIQAYANGGVVGGPTYFPMAGGKTGLMGEAGPEAIMPLKRGANGKLGVQAEGGGGVTVIQNNTFGSGVTRAEVNAMLPKMVEATKAAVADAKLRGGSYGGAFA